MTEVPAKVDGLRQMHRQEFGAFVVPDGFGYFKDRRQVAGFVPHRFAFAPDPVQATAAMLSLAAGEIDEDGLARWIGDNWPAVVAATEAIMRRAD